MDGYLSRISQVFIGASCTQTFDDITTFAIVTTVFLTATIFVLCRFDVRKLPVILLVAAITGFGCQYLFTRVFVVDLPGL